MERRLHAIKVSFVRLHHTRNKKEHKRIIALDGEGYGTTDVEIAGFNAR